MKILKVLVGLSFIIYNNAAAVENDSEVEGEVIIKKEAVENLKHDFDDIGKNLEEFFFNIFENIVLGDETKRNQSEDGKSNKIATTTPTKTEEVTAMFTTEEPTLISDTNDQTTENIKETSLDSDINAETTENGKETGKTENILPYDINPPSVILHNRIKRQVKQYVPNLEYQFNNGPQSRANSGCDSEKDKEHIQDLKEEVKKLHDLVTVLMEQQTVLKMLNNTDQEIERSIKEDKMHLDDPSSKDIKKNLSAFLKQTEDNEIDNIKDQELTKLRKVLQNTIIELNNTNKALTNEIVKENKLEIKLAKQEEDLDNLMEVVDKLLFNATGKHLKLKKNMELVGSGVPSMLPLFPNLFPNSNKTKASSALKSNLTRESEGSRASELSKLLDSLGPQKKSDSLLEELEEALSKRKEEERKLDLLSSLLSQNAQSKSLDNSDALRKKILNMIGKPQSKAENDVAEELRSLQLAINSLRPKDGEFDFGSRNEEADRFQLMLNKIINSQGSGFSSNTNFNKVPNLPNLGLAGSPSLNPYSGLNGINAYNPNFGYNNYPNTGFYFPYNSNQGMSYPSQPFDYGKGLYGQKYGTNPYSAGGFQSFGKYGNGYAPGYPSRYGPSSVTYDAPYNYLNYYGNPSYQSNSGQVGKYGGKLDTAFDQPGSYPASPASTTFQQGYEGQKENQFFPYPQQSKGYEAPPQINPYPTAGGYSAIKGNPQVYPSAVAQASPNNAYQNQKVDDLKTQIYGLESAISHLNSPGYVQKPEDKEAMYNLEHQIHDLKNIVTVLNGNDYTTGPAVSYNTGPGVAYNEAAPQPTYPSKTPPQPQYPEVQKPKYRSKSRNKRSVDDNTIEKNEDDVEKLKTVFNELIKRNKVEEDPDDVHEAIMNLREQLDQRQNREAQERSLETAFSNSYLPNINPMMYQSQQNKFEIKKSKKSDILTKIIIDILDKVIEGLPDILGHLFGSAFRGITDVEGYGDGYGNSYGLEVFKNLGLVGTIPMIILKLVDALTYFMKVLKKNKFVKNFLVPGLLLLTVAGAVVLLIWWFQGDDYDYNKYKRIEGNSYDNSYGHGGYGDTYGNGYQQNSYRSSEYPQPYSQSVNPIYNPQLPHYSRSYFN